MFRKVKGYPTLKEAIKMARFSYERDGIHRAVIRSPESYSLFDICPVDYLPPKEGVLYRTDQPT